jgi:hypothetical protein
VLIGEAFQPAAGGGLRLWVREDLPVGIQLSVRPTGAPAHMPWIQVKVVSRRWDGDCWKLGCRFIDYPPWSALQRLS